MGLYFTHQANDMVKVLKGTILMRSTELGLVKNNNRRFAIIFTRGLAYIMGTYGNPYQLPLILTILPHVA